jgi:hypothetical protein
MFSTPRFLMKPLRFCKAETSLILTKFRYESLYCHCFILNKKGLNNNLIVKLQYKCYSLNKNASTRNNEDTIITPSEPSTTKNGLTNFPHKDNKSKNELLTERIFEIAKTIKNTQHALSIASKTLNEFTGYSVIEKLKEKVIQQGNFSLYIHIFNNIHVFIY